MLFYRAALPVSSRTLTSTAGIIRRHRASTGSPWRKLNPGQQALLVLVYLRKGETFAEVAAGFGVGTSTAWRYVNETVALLAAGAAARPARWYFRSGRNKPEPQKQANKAHAKLRSPGERANAQLKTWRILRKLRCCPWRAGQLAKAIHVLQIREA